MTDSDDLGLSNDPSYSSMKHTTYPVLPRQTTRWVMTAALIILSLYCRPLAHGAVVYSGLVDIPIATTFDGTYLNLDNAAVSTNPTPPAGWDVNFFFGGYGIANSAAFQPVRASTSNMSAVLNLTLGTMVDASSIFATGEAGSDSHMGTGSGQFQSGTDGYIGFRFTSDSSAGPYYGWMRVSLTYNTSGAVIREWAYDDSGVGIEIGALAIPEPSRLFLLAGGLASVMARRRRR